MLCSPHPRRRGDGPARPRCDERRRGDAAGRATSRLSDLDTAGSPSGKETTMHGHARGRRFTLGTLLALGLALLGSGPAALSAAPGTPPREPALARPLAPEPLPGAAAAE